MPKVRLSEFRQASPRVPDAEDNLTRLAKDQGPRPRLAPFMKIICRDRLAKILSVYWAWRFADRGGCLTFR